ncbi:MAG: hypothetical protein IJ124_14755 [Clostridia bacterium]|nr:hypothetical protein [Clostridia bacterium]
MDKRDAVVRRVRAIVALVLVVLYIAGLIAMFVSSVQLGLILWVVSTLGGVGLLYWIHTMNERRQNNVQADDGGKDGQAS